MRVQQAVQQGTNKDRSIEMLGGSASLPRMYGHFVGLYGHFVGVAPTNPANRATLLDAKIHCETNITLSAVKNEAKNS